MLYETVHFFRWMGLFKQLLWDLSEIIDETNRRVFLQRIVNAKKVEVLTWVTLNEIWKVLTCKCRRFLHKTDDGTHSWLQPLEGLAVDSRILDRSTEKRNFS